jgi:hypothetical protein
MQGAGGVGWGGVGGYFGERQRVHRLAVADSTVRPNIEDVVGGIGR